ncbi:MAG: MFS transporter [Pseudomonadota bacterium]
MTSPLENRAFARLFAAQLLSLVANGLVVVALALSAHAFRPDAAGALLATALIGKMLVYVTVAPVVGAYIDRLPRRNWLVTLDLARAGLLLWLAVVGSSVAFVLLVAVFYMFSAAFTPVYQAAIPDLLDDEQYVKALSWSRLAQELEGMAGPLLAAGLLFVADHTRLYALSAVLLIGSAALVWWSRVPSAAASERAGGVLHNLLFGISAYTRTPRLRGLLALHAVVSFSGALVIVNTVVLVREYFELPEHWVPLTAGAAGVGAVLAAWSVPGLLRRTDTRTVMLSGALVALLGLGLGVATRSHTAVLFVWFLVGVGGSLILTPSGRIIIASCHDSDRSALFATNFSLSHGIWLLAYASAGFLGAVLPVDVWFWLHAAISGLALLLAVRLWPRDDPDALLHRHDALDHDHLHTHDDHHQHVHEGWEGPEPHRHPHHHAATRHAHPFVIDEHHRHWPR